MISVVVYGRNDAHGYNLHKRAAISLNCIAERLDAPEDEILFVDYNTADDLPTFPEAIADTLTDAAKARLRIFRVRPALHQRFAHATHLPVIEPIARNVAIRRSNPANRWILASNTDMIFRTVPADKSLSKIAAELEDGFYHTPRFEVPESVWESFDRKDPARILAEIDDVASALHLHSVTLGSEDILYDAPGDFQLMLRADLFEIDSFHEGMLLGWHLDANIARRLRLHRGPVKSALDVVHAYHCDHTRQATLMHSGKRRENLITAAVDMVAQPALPRQRESWGFAGEEIEEIRLNDTRSARFVAAVSRAIGAPQAGMQTTEFIGDNYNDPHYDVRHVLPYLVDLFTSLPAGPRIALFMMRTDAAKAFVDAMSAIDPDARFLIDAEWSWLAELAGEKVEALGQEHVLDRADVFVFEMGLTHADGADVGAVRAPVMLAAHEAVIALERKRLAKGEAGRRLVAVNATHNVIERIWIEDVHFTVTPYSTRVRQGFVRAENAARDPEAELATLTDIVARVVGSEDAATWSAAESAAAPLLARLKQDGGESLGVAPERARDLAQRLSASRDARRALPALQPYGAREESPKSVCHLADPGDWEEPKFANWTRRFMGGLSTTNWFKRDLWHWERIALLTALDSALDLSPRADGERRRVLVLSREPEVLAAALASLGLRVDAGDPSMLLTNGAAPRDWRGEVEALELLRFEKPGRFDPEGDVRYDAVIAAHNALMVSGADGAAQIMMGLHRHLAVGGVLLAAMRVRLAGGSDETLGPESVLGDRLNAGVAAAGGFEPLAPFDARLSSAALDRVGEPTGAIAPPFVDTSAGYETSGVWGWRKISEDAVNSAALATAWSARTPPKARGADKRFETGSQMRRLQPGEGVALTPLSLRAPAPAPGAMLAEAALGIIDPGPYELVIEGRAGNGDAAAKAFAVTARLGPRVVLERDVSAADFAAGRVVMPFDVRDGAPLHISLSGGAGAIEVTELAVR